MDAKRLQVQLGERSYPIIIGQHLLQQLPDYLHELNIQQSQKLLIITDDHVGPLYAHPLEKTLMEEGFQTYLYTIPAGEQSKSLAEYEKIISYAMDHQLDRKSVILALGGGVVGDIAGFVASTYMRGVPFIQLPTTILAHDSSVGGKVAINHPMGKNMIGSFYQPLAVIYDTQTLQSLPDKEIRAGYAEVIKEALIWDASFYTWLLKHKDECLRLEEPYLSEALYRGCQTKASVVSEDEKELGIRAILNFGHTFGHAFESLGAYKTYSHGEAVSIGMVFAARLSEQLYQQPKLEEKVTTILTEYGLPTELHQAWNVDDILRRMYADKKVDAGSLNLIVLKQIGHAVIRKNVSPDLIKSVFTPNPEEANQSQS